VKGQELQRLKEEEEMHKGRRREKAEENTLKLPGVSEN